MLVCGRPEMTARAIRSFEAQSYQNKELIRYENNGLGTIGHFRNAANALATGDIICHFDTDDLSHTARLTEQVALLTASGADCVGYQDMLFWRQGQIQVGWIPGPGIRDMKPAIREFDGEAWLYANKRSEYAVGTSLMYPRSVWERKNFKSVPHGQTTGREDSLFIQGLKMATVSSLGPYGAQIITKPAVTEAPEYEPRMIASIHAGNLNPYNPEASPSTWRRAPEFDSYCREAMKL